MQTVFFTLCSNNYLAHAKTLGDSLKRSNPEVHFIVGLVDKKHPEIDYDSFKPFEILCFDEIGYSAFDEMISMYDIVEFNTAVKPFYFEYLFNRYGKDSVVYYSDPDIIFYTSISKLNEILTTHNIVITPHLLEAQHQPSLVETSVLNTGLYNLGFIGIKNSDESSRFLNWWQERLKKYCFVDKAHGLYVDQIWINFVPIMFKGVCVLSDPGYNMAWWNMLERRLIKEGNSYYVNDHGQPLVFFHFSGFKPGQMTHVGRIDDGRFTFKERPDLTDIFNEYAAFLSANNYARYKVLSPLINFAEDRKGLKKRIGKSLKFRSNAFVNKYFGV